MSVIPSILFVVLGCGQEVEPGPASTSSPETESPTYTIGANLVVDAWLLPERTAADEGWGERPIGAAVGDDGSGMLELIVGEVFVYGGTREEVEELAAAYGGEIVLEIPSVHEDLASAWVVQFDPDTVDTSSLLSDLQGEEPLAPEELTFSSRDAAATLALSLRESREGFVVSPNLPVESTGIWQGDVQESPSPDGALSATYDSNAFSWPHLQVGGAEDYGVTDAWRFLDAAGAAGELVRVAIVDGGFDLSSDLPVPSRTPSFASGSPTLGSPNAMSCASGPCPWHGFEMASILAGVADNGEGVAGVAHQVADTTYVNLAPSTASIFAALAWLAPTTNRVVNCSFSADVPHWEERRSFGAINTALALVQNHAVVVAAAGNRGIDITSETCGKGGCVDARYHWPCEADGVLCVGGLSTDGQTRAASSNFGAGAVDVFGPWNQYAGATPDDASDLVRAKTGTSGATAFVSGIATMMGAANVDLSPTEVHDLILDTSRTATDPSVALVVDARSAVETALNAWSETGTVPNGETSGPLDVGASPSAEVHVQAVITNVGDNNALAHVRIRGASGDSLVDKNSGQIGMGGTNHMAATDLGRLDPDWHPSTVEVTSSQQALFYELYVVPIGRPGYNDAGLDDASARLLVAPETILGNLRGEEVGHYYEIDVGAGEILDIDGEVTGGPGNLGDLIVTVTHGVGTDTVVNKNNIWGTETVSASWSNPGSAEVVLLHVRNGNILGANELTDFQLTFDVTP